MVKPLSAYGLTCHAGDEEAKHELMPFDPVVSEPRKRSRQEMVPIPLLACRSVIDVRRLKTGHDALQLTSRCYCRNSDQRKTFWVRSAIRSSHCEA